MGAIQVFMCVRITAALGTTHCQGPHLPNGRTPKVAQKSQIGFGQVRLAPGQPLLWAVFPRQLGWSCKGSRKHAQELASGVGMWMKLAGDGARTGS